MKPLDGEPSEITVFQSLSQRSCVRLKRRSIRDVVFSDAVNRSCAGRDWDARVDQFRSQASPPVKLQSQHADADYARCVRAQPGSFGVDHCQRAFERKFPGRLAAGMVGRLCHVVSVIPPVVLAALWAICAVSGGRGGREFRHMAQIPGLACSALTSIPATM